MKLTFLGTGTSHGIPLMACDCDVCLSSDPRDKRMRCSIWLYDEKENLSLLVDTGPELRLQALRAEIQRVDAVLISHAHADHIMGFDDLRRFHELLGHDLPVYASPQTFQRLRQIFPYTFKELMGVQIVPGYLRVDAREVTEPFFIGKWQIYPLEVPHGPIHTLGFMFVQNEHKHLVYLPDYADVPPKVIEQIKGVDFLVIDGLRDEPHPTHLTVQQAIQIGTKAKAGVTYLTHITHGKTHAQREQELPSHVRLAYDNLILEV